MLKKAAKKPAKRAVKKAPLLDLSRPVQARCVGACVTLIWEKDGRCYAEIKGVDQALRLPYKPKHLAERDAARAEEQARYAREVAVRAVGGGVPGVAPAFGATVFGQHDD